MPLSHVFLKTTLHKENSRSSYNPRRPFNEKLRNSLYVYDQHSNREVRKMAQEMGQTIDEMLELEGKNQIFNIKIF